MTCILTDKYITASLIQTLVAVICIIISKQCIAVVSRIIDVVMLIYQRLAWHVAVNPFPGICILISLVIWTSRRNQGNFSAWIMFLYIVFHIFFDPGIIIVISLSPILISNANIVEIKGFLMAILHTLGSPIFLSCISACGTAPTVVNQICSMFSKFLQLIPSNRIGSGAELAENTCAQNWKRLCAQILTEC